ncbi:MAG TPA: hypothetical protein PKE59_00085 [Novosphingobium sp.]|jgi:hypothetical protein|nr:hypothetical protein [Novosphingobium sp.]
MSKRTPGLPRRPRGFWPTPLDAVRPLIPFLPPEADYVEPCAGAGDLIRHLGQLWPAGRCSGAYDLVPNGEGIEEADALSLELRPDLYITNPPWPEGGKRGDPALSIIRHLMWLAPTWVLLPWDFAANAYYADLARHCVRVVPVGRVSWLGNGQGGKDNCGWYEFDGGYNGRTALYPRGLAHGLQGEVSVL